MQHQTKIGQTIAGKYALIKALKESHLYQWIGGINLNTQKVHTIQVLLKDCQKGEVKEAFDYFDDLKNVHRQGIIPPEQVISNKDLPLVIIYPEFFGSILDLSRNPSLELVLKYLFEASELLHILNNKKLIHGQVNPESFILKDNKVYLSGFGYAPFLMQGNKDAIEDCGDFLPPEITDANSANKSRDTIDTYAFAKTIAYWCPNICSSSWYLQATNPDPSQRFKRMRNLFQELKKALTDIFSDTAAEVNAPSNPIEIPETEIKREPESSGGLKPKYILEIELDPPEAGKVEGGGKYAEGRQVNVKATAFPDWEFIGWDGDIVESNNSLDLVIDKNIKIIARYEKIPKPFGSIQIEIFPIEAQEFVKVSGAGNHKIGTLVNINAWSNSDTWRFSRWTGDIGDINVAKTSVTIALTSDIKVVAEFAIVPNLTTTITLHNTLGSAFKLDDNQPISVQETTISPQETITSPHDKLGSAFNQPAKDPTHDLTHDDKQPIPAQTEETESRPLKGTHSIKKRNLGTAFDESK